MITNQAGPYSVKLTRTADYSYKSLNLLEMGTPVTISDNMGNKEILREQSPGVTYLTRSDGIQGVVGRIYKVTIKTRTGQQYKSGAEVLGAAPSIDSVYYEYRYHSQASTNGMANGWDVYIDSKDSRPLGDFYRWDWAHYEFAAVNINGNSISRRFITRVPYDASTRYYLEVNQPHLVRLS